MDSSIKEASHIVLAELRTKNNRWHSSSTDNCTLVPTSPCSTVARSRSSQRCRASSRSFIGTPWATSEGPHKENSRMDFTWLRDMALSFFRRVLIRAASFVAVKSSSRATVAHWHKDPGDSASLRETSSLKLDKIYWLEIDTL